MKLPNIEQTNNNKNPSLIKEKYKIINEPKNSSSSFKPNSFLSRMKEIKEVKIYLKEKFIQKEIDEQFLRDIENEYAEQYLLKMKIFPTKHFKEKILKLCPLKKCDFQLYDETIFINYNEKNVKSLHIFPVFERKRKKIKDLQLKINNNIKEDIEKYNRTNSNDFSRNNTITYGKKNLTYFNVNKLYKSPRNKYNFLSLETSSSNKKISFRGDNFPKKKSLIKISRNRNYINTISSNTNTDYLYNKEHVDDLFAKYRENVANLQLFSNKKSTMKVNLSPENIRSKYISSESNWSNKVYENKGKLTKISKSILSYKNVLNNKKYFFDLRNVKDLSVDIIEEVKEPINPQIELIIKDINYIIDNFPFDEFIHIKDNNQIMNDSKVESENNNNTNLNKIIIKNKKEFIYILKTLSSNDSCRIIILLINLIYWIIFGGNNSIQIDDNTKELLYLKLMKEWETMSSNFIIKSIFYKIYIPLFIIICRIEIENFFDRKYIKLFEDKNNKLIFLKKANAIISEIFDKHGYMNTFNLFCKKSDEFNKKLNFNNIGHYKNKLYATSNFVEMLFRNDTDTLKEDIDIKEKEKFINKYKQKYFSFYLDKMNKHLKRRNLEPIFKIKFKPNEQKEEINILDIKTKKDYKHLDDIGSLNNK